MYYADHKPNLGFRCLECEVIEGPTLSEFLGEKYESYKIRFVEPAHSELEGVFDIGTDMLFSEPVELEDLPSHCYWP